MFDQALNPSANEYVAFYCDEPQGVRIKLGQKAPRLQTGFVPGERGFQTYNYNFPANTNPVLSIRLAKAAQFETVKNADEEATNGSLSYDVNHLWLPIRNAVTQYPVDGVIQKSDDDNIYLASTNDPTWDKKISAAMSGNNPSLPIVGKIVKLNAIDTSKNSEKTEKDENRLCIYFIKYLTDYRMNAAKDLLMRTSKKSNEIGLMVGYKDPHYFSYLFKKTQGVTPTQYRSSGHGEE
jgi:AraC-like DNA-binding protein